MKILPQRSKATTEGLHPERMEFNSRGRAALREAHGEIRQELLTLKGSNNPYVFDPFRVHTMFLGNSVGFAQGRLPTAIDFGPCGTRNNVSQKARSWRFVPQTLIVFVFLLSNLGFGAAAQTPTASPTPASSSADVSEIKAYTAEVDRFSKRRKFRTFGIFYQGDKDSWRELKGKSDQQLNESCDVWTRDGKVVLAFFGFTSDSGDWYHFIKYYYRADGTLAKIQARLNTFYGNVSVLRDRYYDASGKLLKSTRRYLDMQTHKPVKSANFHDEPIPMFSKASALPFYRLL